MAILYVAAEAAELEPFCQLLESARKLKWPLDYAWEGILNGRRVMLAANGAGPRLAARAVETAIRAISAADLSASLLEAVVSTGFCGALDPQLQEGQIVLATAVLDAATGETTPCETLHSAPDGAVSGIILSQDRVANSASEKRELQARGAIAVDMESAGVLARSQRGELPFYCIKAVTDRVDESFAIDLNRMRTPEGRIARGKIGMYTLTHPHLLRHLFHLKGRADKAARGLGEFLASCRIKPDSDNATAS
jgi:adenosylhomocysteine nucleosidase